MDSRWIRGGDIRYPPPFSVLGLHLAWTCTAPVHAAGSLCDSYMSQSIVSRRSCFPAAFQPSPTLPWALKGGRGLIAVSHLGLGVPRSLTLHVASCGVSCVSFISDEFPYCHFQEHELLKWLYQLLTTYKCLRKSEAPWESPYSMTSCWWAQSCTDLVPRSQHSYLWFTLLSSLAFLLPLLLWCSLSFEEDYIDLLWKAGHSVVLD